MADHRFEGEHIYQGMVMQPITTVENIQRVTDLNVVDGDIVIATYPKTGTTWVENLTWLAVHQGGDGGDVPLHERVRYLEAQLGVPECGLELAARDPRPAIMKTHLPANFLQRQTTEGRLKVIVLIRNPKDTLVSYFHFYRMNVVLGNFQGSWHDFFELYKSKRLIYGDYFAWYESWLPYVDLPNVHLMHYEDMKFDMPGVIKKLTSFLGISLTSSTVDQIIQQTSFGAMKNNKTTNYKEMPVFNMEISDFMRKGEVGDWKNYFTEDQSKLVDDVYKETLAAKGLVLKFE